MGPPLGPVEFHWLRQALADAREVHPERHRLQRADASGLAGLVAGLFETLQLERGTDAELGLWGLEIDGYRRGAMHWPTSTASWPETNGWTPSG